MPDYSNWDDLSWIDLQDNPWACDCHNQWLLTRLMQQIKDRTPELTYR